MTPDSISFSYLARASMKRGGEGGYQDALKYLQEVAEIGLTPEVILGFAHYHRTEPDIDLDAAKRFYLRAAVGGRFGGVI